eukprot:Phypoly_transcript_16277.p1 GENE.Phypoly_transcript_16277~~Phypoly_transcript_16277.p1  ORF type:complete len:194 (+),score=25.15 Phypoly_transcript_16277:89-670(+)
MKVLSLFIVCLCIFTITCVAQNTTDSTTSTPSSTGGVGTTGASGNGTTGSTTGGGPVTNSTCGAFTDCGTCTSNTHCVWCDKAACVDGFFYGTRNVKQCGDWRWKQCKVNGRYAFIGALIAVGVVLLIMVICICKCCCCQKKKSSYSIKQSKTRKAERESLLDEEEQRSAHPITDQRRAQMREKWGIKDRSVN